MTMPEKDQELTRDEALLACAICAADGDVFWPDAVKRARCCIAVAPLEIRRALALDAEDGKVGLADMYERAKKSREEIQAYAQRLERDFVDMTKMRDGARVRAEAAEARAAAAEKRADHGYGCWEILRERDIFMADLATAKKRVKELESESRGTASAIRVNGRFYGKDDIRELIEGFESAIAERDALKESRDDWKCRYESVFACGDTVTRERDAIKAKLSAAEERVKELEAEVVALTKKLSRSESHEERVMAERDRLNDKLDEFVEALGGIDRHGEHSNMNDPWQSALDRAGVIEDEIVELKAKLSAVIAAAKGEA